MTASTTNSIAKTAHELPLLRRFAGWAKMRLLELQARRAQLASLRQLKSHDLKDTGLIENDISDVNFLPLSSDAATSLYRASLERSGNW